MLDEPWALSPSVALRPEPFGALAYHFGNRKLTFLKRPELVASFAASPRSLTCGVPWPQPAYRHTSTRRTPRRCAASPRPT